MIKLIRAIVAGLLGAAAIVILTAGALALLRYAPNSGFADYRTVIATTVVAEIAIIAAVIVAIIIGGAFIAVGYALAFEFITRKAGWWIGALFGVAQAIGLWLCVGLLVWWFPDVVRPAAPEVSLLFNSLRAIGAVVVLHAIYGAIVGSIYGAPVHSSDVETRVLWRQLYSARQG